MFASGSATLTGTFVHTGQRRINPTWLKSNSMIIEPYEHDFGPVESGSHLYDGYWG